MNISNINAIQKLLPPANILPEKKATPGPGGIENLLQDIQQIKSFQIQLKVQSIYDKAGKASEDDYSIYLQFPNISIKELATSITQNLQTNDEKAYNILMWVKDNIQYKTDIENYGKMEYWALPTETVKRGLADCEDQAFLIHSLMLNAGVPWERIKTYGGYVYAGPGAPYGGHGWTAYQRETDNEWVVLDACYYPSDLSINDRTPLKEDRKYIDDFFYVNLLKTVDTTYFNTLRMIGSRVNITA